jgi:hypothetical protein
LAKNYSAHSWEYGATVQAALEVNNPELSVFSSNAFPNGRLPKAPKKVDGLGFAKKHIRLNKNTLANGEGAMGDPASLGVGALLLGQAANGNSSYTKAARKQKVYVMRQSPRFYNGALSQRRDVAELWADNVFMSPPFLAYYAVSTNNATLLRMAVQQCGLYRNVLQANTTASWHGLWTHIVGPQSQSLGVWATGNGWAALGMVRVLATVKSWNVSDSWQTEQAQLTTWIGEIMTGLANVQSDKNTGLLKNYLVGGASSASDTSIQWFGDGAGTAALVAAALRFAVLVPSTASSMVKLTKPLRAALIANTNATTGVISPVVNPYNWYDSTPYTKVSPEAQAFLAMAGSAWRDCIAAKVCKLGS